MNVWKKWGAALILIGAALFLGTILTACNRTTVPEKPVAPVSQSAPSEPEKEVKESIGIGSSPVSPVEERLKQIPEDSSSVPEEKPIEEPLRILVESDTRRIVFQLNGSSAAKDLYRQLPLTVPVENYGNNEKIFYPPEKLSTEDTPIAQGPAGTLAYYAPWGDIAPAAVPEVYIS